MEDIERKIVTGLILSTNFTKRIDPLIKIKWFQTEESKRIANWCLRYFRRYGKAPNQYIQDIYQMEVENLDKDVAEMIETVLFSLSEEYDRTQFNVDFYLDEAEKYFKKRQLEDFLEEREMEIDSGAIEEAQAALANFEPVQAIGTNGVVPLETQEQVKAAFEDILNPLINFGQTDLGSVLNRLMYREALVGIMAKNKGGKTFQLMDIAWRAARQGCKVAFFQGGDMSQKQQERRMGIWLCRKSDLPEYCQKMYIPVLDCVYNQTGECNYKYRECNEAPFSDRTPQELRWEANALNKLKTSDLKMAVDSYGQRYRPCINCLRIGKKRSFKGTIWYKVRPPVKPLTWKEVYKAKKKESKILKNIRLITYSSETLNMAKIKAEWDIMKKQDFIPDVGLIDYADVLEPDDDMRTKEKRTQTDSIWRRGRRLSMDEKALIIMATQADTPGMEADILTRSNFTNSKTIFDHVTGMVGLNMTDFEREKGTMRINNIVDREAEEGKVVNVTHSLPTGRPILGSFW